MGKRLMRAKGKNENACKAKREDAGQGNAEKSERNGQGTDASRCYQRGKEYLVQGELLKAITMLEEVITLDPHCIEAFLKLGNCYEKLKKYEKAVACYERALELDPTRLVTRYSLGVALQLLGLPLEAKKEYLKVLASDENHLMARNNLAAVYLKEGRREEAIEEFRKVVSIDPQNAESRNNLKIVSGEDSSGSRNRVSSKKGISLCMVVGDEEKEVKDFFNLAAPFVDEIIIVDTGDRMSHNQLADEYGAKVIHHSWEESLSVLRNVSLRHASYEWILVLNPDEYISRDGFFYVKSLIKHQDFQGFRFIQRNYLNCPSLSGWVPCTDKVKQVWNSCGWIPSYPVKLFRNHEGIFFESVIRESVEKSIYRRGGKIGKANILVHHCEQLRDPEKQMARGKRLLKLSKRQRSLTPGDPSVYYDLALRYAKLNELDQAIATFEELMRLTPGNAGIYNDLGNIYFEKGEYQKARDLYQNSLRLDPHFFQAHYNLANLLLLAGDLDTSLKAYLDALALFPECGQIYSNLGILYEKKGEDEEAIRKCERAIALNPFLPQAYNNLGVLYDKKGDRLKAEENYLHAIHLDTGYADAYYNLGKLHLKGGARDKAERIFEEALRYNPTLSTRW